MASNRLESKIILLYFYFTLAKLKPFTFAWHLNLSVLLNSLHSYKVIGCSSSSSFTAIYKVIFKFTNGFFFSTGSFSYKILAIGWPYSINFVLNSISMKSQKGNSPVPPAKRTILFEVMQSRERPRPLG